MKGSLNRFLACATFAIASISGGLSGCETTGSHHSDSRSSAGVTVEASSRDVLVGDTVTFIAHTRDTYGRDAKLKWSSTAGKLTTEQDGRVARVKFDESGTYSVKAALNVDGRELESDLVEIRVKPIPH
jgi:uncharacterized protein YjdB